MVIISCILFVATCILVASAICEFNILNPVPSIVFLMCAFVAWCMVWIIPTSSESKVVNEISEYVKISPLPSGCLLVANLETNKLIHEYDIRFIKAYEENQLFIKTTRNFNFFRYKISEKASLEINKE